MKKLTTISFTLLIAIAVFSISAAAQGKPAETQKSGTLESLLKEGAADYEATSAAGAFISIYEGKINKEITVFMTETEGSVAMLTDVADAKEVNLTPAVMRKLLEYCVSVDYVKVGISDNGSIRVQVEHKLEGMSAETLKMLMLQVASANDEVAKIIQSVRKKAEVKK